LLTVPNRVGGAPGRGGPARDDDAPREGARLTRRRGVVEDEAVDLEVDALISIGGDDTLKTANFLYEYQRRLPPEAPRVSVVHIPKTIDNDYRGIDFTFGFFTAVDVMAKELQNLRADAIATSSYFVVETMGRKAGWLSYGVAIAGESNLVIAIVQDQARRGQGIDTATPALQFVPIHSRSTSFRRQWLWRVALWSLALLGLELALVAAIV